jgi:ubiquitin C-terminal hydrolase
LTLGLSENGSAGNISGFTPANDTNDTGNVQRKGIPNQGNTCFIGSILIALFHSHELTKFVLNQSHSGDESDFRVAYRHSMEGLNSGEGVSPIGLMVAMLGYEDIRLANDLFCVNDEQKYEQQDASEALICIMQIFKKQSENYRSFIKSLFGFALGKIIKCDKCGAERTRMDSGQSQVLPIPIPEYSGRQSKFNFQTLLSNYFNMPEKMAEVECYICGNNQPGTECGKKQPGTECGKMQEGTVQPQLFTHPEIFIFTLNRFKSEVRTVFTGRASRRTKNSQEEQGAQKELSIDKLECFIGLLYSYI